MKENKIKRLKIRQIFESSNCISYSSCNLVIYYLQGWKANRFRRKELNNCLSRSDEKSRLKKPLPAYALF